MKKITIYLLAAVMLSACDVLDKYPLDRPSQDTFWNNASEISSGVAACYRFLIAQPGVEYLFPVAPDTFTDIGFPRQECDWKKVAKGEHDANTHSIREIWHYAYQGIGRCNLMLRVIEDKASILTDAQYDRFRGECLFLRSMYLARLVSFYGDVPLVLEPIDTEAQSAEYVRENKDVIYKQVIEDLSEAANLLPDRYTLTDEIGRATSGAAYAYMARTALYEGDWETAAEAAQAVIASGVYELYQSYGDLFLVKGLTDPGNREVIMQAEFSAQIPLYHELPLYMQSRNLLGYACMVPTQNLIDSYLCTDGLTIEDSPLFDKNNPFENRDPRMKLGNVVPGERYGDFQFESHVDSTTCYNYATDSRVNNLDCYNNSQYTSYTGYYSRKFCDPIYADQHQKADYPLILCRYAEVLLTYAEAKIEMGEVDQSVVNAMNQIRRNRDDVKMPALNLSDLSDPAQARRILRYERKVELAFEGFRYFDLKRWPDYWKYADRPIMGRPFKGDYSEWPDVTFDENGEPIYDYNNYEPHPSSDYRLVENRVFIPGKHELWPIPQRERNVSPQLTQNPGF